MKTRRLSRHEEDIVRLATEGCSNEAIAEQLRVDVAFINAAWLKMRLQSAGGATEGASERVIKSRAEQGLRDSNIERRDLDKVVATQEQNLLDLRASLALLHLALDQIKSTVWATDSDLVIRILANGKFPTTHFGVVWEVGKTVYEIFKTHDKDYPAVAAHLAALAGEERDIRLTGEFEHMSMQVSPLRDESGEVIGCISVMNSVGAPK